MGDRRDGDKALAFLLADGDDNDAGPVLNALVAALILLVPPQIGVADDEAGNRFRQGHALTTLVRGRKRQFPRGFRRP